MKRRWYDKGGYERHQLKQGYLLSGCLEEKNDQASTTLMSNKESKRDWMSERDLGIRYGKGAEKVGRTDWELENRITNSKLEDEE